MKLTIKEEVIKLVKKAYQYMELEGKIPYTEFETFFYAGFARGYDETLFFDITQVEEMKESKSLEGKIPYTEFEAFFYAGLSSGIRHAVEKIKEGIKIKTIKSH